MCSLNNSTGSLVPLGLKIGAQLPYYIPSQMGFELQRAQLQDYAQRFHLGIHAYSGAIPGLTPMTYHGYLVNPYVQPYFCKDTRARFVHEEPKPNHSYIGLIAMAILSSRDKKLVLSDIYQWILDNYNYFRTRGPGWRNSIRHNLSLNDCFIKVGRSANGKGHYWAIHPANFEDFQKGDFRRRRAQRRVRKHMGLSVPDDDDDDSPSPSPLPQQQFANWSNENNVDNLSMTDKNIHIDIEQDKHAVQENDSVKLAASLVQDHKVSQENTHNILQLRHNRRQFDMESILAPEPENQKMRTSIRNVSAQPVHQLVNHDRQRKTAEKQTQDEHCKQLIEFNVPNQSLEISNKSESENISDCESCSNNERVKLRNKGNMRKNMSIIDNSENERTLSESVRSKDMEDKSDISVPLKNLNKAENRNCSSAPIFFENERAVDLSKVTCSLDHSTINYVPKNSQAIFGVQSIRDRENATAISSLDRHSYDPATPSWACYPYLLQPLQSQNIDAQVWHQSMKKLLSEDLQTYMYQKE